MIIKERRVFMDMEPCYDYYEEVLVIQEFALKEEEILERSLTLYNIKNGKEFLKINEDQEFFTFTPYIDFDSLGKLPDGYGEEILKNILDVKKNVLENSQTLSSIASFEELLELCSSTFNVDEQQKSAFNYMLNNK